VRFYQASSSEMYGRVDASPQNEHTQFHPRSPYACAKVFAYWQTINYREAHGLFACNGILFNHESPRRLEKFVTRKIARAAARIKLGFGERLVLGNLDACRDWGYARDYVRAMWLMLQQPEPGDYVVATGEAHSVRDFLQAAFSYVDLDWREFIDVDPRLFRPAEVDIVCGDATLARERLGWQPSVTFDELVRLMVDHDLELAQREVASRGAEASSPP
jgi:GDPmannose 4,6-dehydratase